MVRGIKICIAFLVISYVCYGQMPLKKVIGTYEYCGNNCLSLKLKSDSTFTYFIDYYMVGKGEINGNWNLLNDTIVLNFQFPDSLAPKYHEAVIDSLSGKKVIYQKRNTVSQDAGSAMIVLNNNDTLLVNENGEVSTNLNQINKVEVIDMDWGDTTTYLVKNEASNLILIDVPVLPAFYVWPKKWLIKKRKLYPLNWYNQINSKGYLKKITDSAK